jgi:hypothetical protein
MMPRGRPKKVVEPEEVEVIEADKVEPEKVVAPEVSEYKKMRVTNGLTSADIDARDFDRWKKKGYREL